MLTQLLCPCGQCTCLPVCRSQSGNSPEDSTTVELSEPVAARFGLKYLTGGRLCSKHHCGSFWMELQRWITAPECLVHYRCSNCMLGSSGCNRGCAATEMLLMGKFGESVAKKGQGRNLAHCFSCLIPPPPLRLSQGCQPVVRCGACTYVNLMTAGVPPHFLTSILYLSPPKPPPPLQTLPRLPACHPS